MNTNEKFVKGGDRKSLRLHEEEVKLIRALKKLDKQVIVIFYSGSAVITEEWAKDADAILYAGYPGMEGGNALANIISGKVNPSGKLPFTVARDENDYPYFPYTSEKDQSVDYDYDHGYVLFDRKGMTPEYPFGFGLSYTTFAYTGAEAWYEEGRIHVRVRVRNTGSRYGEESVLVFAGSGIPGKPHKLLKGFARTALEPGEEKDVEILIEKEDLRLYNKESGKMEIPDDPVIYVGKNAQDAENIVLKLMSEEESRS